jgi:GT2 family glycosyltransferase/glycosyltransferase involved in cell wall biosynthesis
VAGYLYLPATRDAENMKLVIVLGMHRSGTSAVTELLQDVGVHLGLAEELLPAAGDNPRGFFEHAGVKSINDAVLAKLGGSWDAPPSLSPRWFADPRLAPQRARARDLLTQMAADAPGDRLVAVKDPRFSLTLPFWRELVDIVHVVHCLRAPCDVASSLQRRNGFERPRSEALWIDYTLGALLDAPDALFVQYGELVGDTATVEAQLVCELGLPAAGERSDVIDPFLDHGGGAPTELAEAAWFYDVLCKSTVDERRAVADLLRQRVGRFESLVELVSVMAEHQTARADAIERRDSELERSRERTANLQNEMSRRAEETSGALRRSAGELAEVQQLHATGLVEVQQRHVTEMERLTAELARLRSETARAWTLSEDLERRTARTQRDLAATHRRLTRLRNRRLVRAALRLAGLAQPLFRVVRRLRSGSFGRTVRRDEAGSSGASLSGPSTSPAVANRTAVPEVTSASFELIDPLTLAADPLGGTVSVVVPVYDAPEAVDECLASVRRHTTAVDIIVIDDASPDPRTRVVLERHALDPRVRILRNEVNLGYTGSVNRGIAEASGDVILLNSDTIVPPRWTENLRLALATDDTIGTVTAVSDNAGAFSVPVIGELNPLAPGLDGISSARLVAQSATWRLPDVTTCHGFCVLLRRSMLDEVGTFDEVAFSRGYGEENDFSMRAAAAGWRHVVQEAVLVQHRKGASFGAERDALITQGRAVVDERWPSYTSEVRRTFHGTELVAMRKRVADAYAAVGPKSGLPRVLAYLHEGRGGTPNTTLDLARTMSDRWESFILTCNTQRLLLSVVRDGELVELDRFDLNVPITFGEVNRADVRDILVRVLLTCAIDLVHVRHVVKSTFDIFDVAAELNIPTVTSFHDFYLSCPTIHLLDDQDRFCGGACTAGDGACRVPMEWVSDSAPPLKHQFVHDWRALVQPRLEKSKLLVTTSEQARSIIRGSYPDAALPPFEVIEHGRDLKATPVPWDPPVAGGKIRIAIPGNLDVHKGSDFIQALRDADVDRRLELHFLGGNDVGETVLGTSHGRYERHEFAREIAKIRPHMIGIFSIWAETYCHILSEAWMTGIPVVATDLGALGERVAEHGGGLLVPHDDSARTLSIIIAAADDPARLTSAAGVVVERVRTLDQMADDYEVGFRGALGVAEDALPQIGLVALGSRNQAPGSVNVRAIRPFAHSANIGDLSVAMRSGDDARGWDGFDVVHVLRNAVPTDVVPRFLAEVTRVAKLSFDVDDLLFDEQLIASVAPEYADGASVMLDVMRAADLVTVSTEPLAEAAGRLGVQTTVVPNQLDERLWFTPQASQRTTTDGQLRLLYVGSATHDRDLALLRPVLAELRAGGINASLTVVGVSRRDGGWYQRLRHPASHYPEFVQWLRGVAGGFDVAVAPLEPTVFTEAKSDLKFLEYAALGLPAIYSDTGPYAASVDHGSTGLLAPDTAGWVDSLSQLARDTDASRALARNAHELVRTSRTLASTSDGSQLTATVLALLV